MSYISIGSSARKSLMACEPMTESHSIGLMPDPGRLVVMLWSVRGSPLRIERDATMLFRATVMLGCSVAVTSFISDPRIFSTSLIDDTISLSSSVDSDALWSGPGISWSRVKCFSIISAPRATAAIGTSIPLVWSLYPTPAHPNSFSESIARRLTASCGVGYWVVQWSR